MPLHVSKPSRGPLIGSPNHPKAPRAYATMNAVRHKRSTPPTLLPKRPKQMHIWAEDFHARFNSGMTFHCSDTISKPGSVCGVMSTQSSLLAQLLIGYESTVYEGMTD